MVQIVCLNHDLKGLYRLDGMLCLFSLSSYPLRLTPPIRTSFFEGFLFLFNRHNRP